MADPHNHPETIYEIHIDDSLMLKALDEKQSQELFTVVDRNRTYLMQWLPWVSQTMTVEDSTDFIRQIGHRRTDGSEYGYGIIHDNYVIGHISLMHITDLADPEIGYWISEDFSGRGLTTKAAEAVTNLAFETLGLNKVVIKADSQNIGSNKVAEKLGYNLERQEESDEQRLTNIWAKHKSYDK